MAPGELYISSINFLHMTLIYLRRREALDTNLLSVEMDGAIPSTDRVYFTLFFAARLVLWIQFDPSTAMNEKTGNALDAGPSLFHF